MTSANVMLDEVTISSLVAMRERARAEQATCNERLSTAKRGRRELTERIEAAALDEAVLAKIIEQLPVEVVNPPEWLDDGFVLLGDKTGEYRPEINMWLVPSDNPDYDAGGLLSTSDLIEQGAVRHPAITRAITAALTKVGAAKPAEPATELVTEPGDSDDPTDDVAEEAEDVAEEEPANITADTVAPMRNTEGFTRTFDRVMAAKDERQAEADRKAAEVMARRLEAKKAKGEQE